MKGTNKHTWASLKRFNNHRYLSRSEESKWLRKTSVIAKTFQWSFLMFMCIFDSEIFHFCRKSLRILFLFLCYPYFGIYKTRVKTLYKNELQIVHFVCMKCAQAKRVWFSQRTSRERGFKLPRYLNQDAVVVSC